MFPPLSFRGFSSFVMQRYCHLAKYVQQTDDKWRYARAFLTCVNRPCHVCHIVISLPCQHCRCDAMPTAVFQFVLFCLAKGRLLGCNLRPFARRFAANCRQGRLGWRASGRHAAFFFNGNAFVYGRLRLCDENKNPFLPLLFCIAPNLYYLWGVIAVGRS